MLTAPVKHFFVTITSYQCQASNLIIFHLRFIYFLYFIIHNTSYTSYWFIISCLEFDCRFQNLHQKAKFKYVILHRPFQPVKCKLLIRTNPKRSTKIGKGWKQSCKLNHLLKGFTLAFEVHSFKPNKNIKVLILKYS